MQECSRTSPSPRGGDLACEIVALCKIKSRFFSIVYLYIFRTAFGLNSVDYLVWSRRARHFRMTTAAVRRAVQSELKIEIGIGIEVERTWAEQARRVVGRAGDRSVLNGPSWKAEEAAPVGQRIEWHWRRRTENEYQVTEKAERAREQHVAGGQQHATRRQQLQQQVFVKSTPTQCKW